MEEMPDEVRKAIMYAISEAGLSSAFERIEPLLMKVMSIFHRLGEQNDDEALATLIVIAQLIETASSLLTIALEPNSRLAVETAQKKLMQLLIYAAGLEKLSNISNIMEKVTEFVELLDQLTSTSPSSLPY
ncbi:MAG: hypothetical protein QXS32_07705 [Candidatus Nezhaarchaeales archaeon]